MPTTETIYRALQQSTISTCPLLMYGVERLVPSTVNSASSITLPSLFSAKQTYKPESSNCAAKILEISKR